MVLAGVPSGPSSTSVTILPGTSQRTHQIVARPLLGLPDASPERVCDHASMPAHGYRLEGKGRSAVQTVQNDFSPCWMGLLICWTGGLCTSLFDSLTGLSDLKAAQRDRPGFTCHQNHVPGNRQVYGQPGGVRAPPMADADGDQGYGQGPLPGLPGLPHWSILTRG